MGRLKERLHTGEINAQEALVMALNHPLRVKLLTILTERTASPNEMQRMLSEPLGLVAYHSRVLDELGQIEVVEEQPVRGAMEHFYRAVNRPFFDTPDWEKFDPKVRRAVSAYGVDAIFKDAAAALGEGTFDAREDRHLSRTPMLVDEKGWEEANAIQNDALQQLLEVQARSAERMNGSEESGIPVIAAMACFELPKPGARA